MRESELLAHIYERSKGLVAAGATLLVGPGDDCAVIGVGGASGAEMGPSMGQLLLTVDQVVEGRHFVRETPIDLIARKAMARAVSDVAAMGGTAMVGLCGAVLPRDYAHGEALFDAMARWAVHFGAPLIGGDISSLGAEQAGPLVLAVTIVGRVHPRRGAVLRSGALAGDGVYVTGRLGNSLASGRHLTFEPRLAEGTWLCDELGADLHAMMDISDGLGRDAARLGVASGVGLELDASALPLHADCATWKCGASDGEDYELLFTATGSKAVPAKCPATGTAITRIGRVVPSITNPAVVTFRMADGSREAGDGMGWEHGEEGPRG